MKIRNKEAMNVDVKTFGIDVSKHNGIINWQQVKASGKVDFVILRSGFGKFAPNQKDIQFERNYAECKKYGIPVGVYHYSYALSVVQAEEEAEFVIDILKGKQFEYPIYFDIEEKAQEQLSKEQCTAMVTAFCDKLEEAGYWCGFYSYDAFYATDIVPGTAERYANWVASIENRIPTSCKNYEMWQYSWKGRIPGISTNVDLNECYVDYPTIIKQAGKNGFGTVSQAIAKPQYRFTVDCGTEGECQTIQNVIVSNLGEGYKGLINKI